MPLREVFAHERNDRLIPGLFNCPDHECEPSAPGQRPRNFAPEMRVKIRIPGENHGAGREAVCECTNRIIDGPSPDAGQNILADKAPFLCSMAYGRSFVVSLVR